MNFSKEEIRIHWSVLLRARETSMPLANAIANVGPVSTRARRHSSIGGFLAGAIIGQQLSANAARSIRVRVTRAAGDVNMAVPEFAETYPERVRQCGVSSSKVRALQSVYAAECNGTLCEAQLRELEPSERVRTLLGVRGVGPWTCDMALIFYYRLPDIWPEGDAAVQRTFKRLIGRKSPAQTAGRFSPYRSSLALAMWRVVDEKLA